MDSNKLYYLVGLAGAGKTTICKQLAGCIEGGVAPQTSGRFMDFIKEKGIENPKSLDAIPHEEREALINGLHHSFLNDKQNNSYTFLDGHMFVMNLKTGLRVNAMATENNNVSNGLIFLNTPCEVIASNIDSDNNSGKRNRSECNIDVLNELAEAEFQGAEDYCLLNSIGFGILHNIPKAGEFCEVGFDDVYYLNDYYLSTDAKLRQLYKAQFESNLSPSCLRKKHYEIGTQLVVPFIEKTGVHPANYQVLSIPRSGNYIASGFCDSFDGRFIMSKMPEDVVSDIDKSKALVIIDSVIDTGNTICNILESFPNSYQKPIHVVCLAINIKALEMIEGYSGRVEFHCLGFSNKANRPKGIFDMGARLYGTPN
jgi:adenylate kinase/uracil phosphoribosyltransferase